MLGGIGPRKVHGAVSSGCRSCLDRHAAWDVSAVGYKIQFVGKKGSEIRFRCSIYGWAVAGKAGRLGYNLIKAIGIVYPIIGTTTKNFKTFSQYA